MFPIPQSSFLVETFSATSYSKTALVGTGLIQRMFDLKVGCNFINILAPLYKQLVDSAQRSGIVGISRNLFHEKSWLSRAHRLFFNQSFFYAGLTELLHCNYIEQYYISCYNIIF
jgi:hypothetical protein